MCKSALFTIHSDETLSEAIRLDDLTTSRPPALLVDVFSRRRCQLADQHKTDHYKITSQHARDGFWARDRVHGVLQYFYCSAAKLLALADKRGEQRDLTRLLAQPKMLCFKAVFSDVESLPHEPMLLATSDRNEHRGLHKLQTFPDLSKRAGTMHTCAQDIYHLFSSCSMVPQKCLVKQFVESCSRGVQQLYVNNKSANYCVTCIFYIFYF